MIKNIQHYLLTNYPLLWNIKVAPMILVLTGVHLFFFFVGYSAVDTRFEYSSSYYSPFNEISGLTYFACILVGILILIGWLVFYNRNNSFRTFYPRRHIHVYIEWLLIWGITAAIAFTPITIMYGNLSAWRFIMPKSEAIKSVELAEKIAVLIPTSNDGYFTFDLQKDKAIPIPDKANLIVDSLDLDLYSFDYNREGELIINGYVGNSLLFYSKYFNSYYGEEMKSKATSEVEEIKQWLINGDKEKICALMSEYLAHLEKYNFPANITTEEWYDQINKPPFFSIDDIYITYSDDENSLSTQHRILNGGHKRIISSYENDEIADIILICLCVSLLLSVFIFSSRVTSGKTWIASLIITGVLSLFSTLVAVSGFYILSSVFFWILLFAIALAHIIIQIREGYKGKSRISINIFLWMIPAIFPILYACINAMSYNSSSSIVPMFWINIPLSIILMWFATKLIHQWKSIAED